jgi:proteasome lid subunit RPN8/RPN11
MHGLVDSSGLRLSRAACFSIIASAIEVFPKECMGGVCVKTGDRRKVVSAVPYQVAKRSNREIISESSYLFGTLLKQGGFRKLGDYHSHAFRQWDVLTPLEPSGVDLKELPIGGIEIIVSIRRTNKNAFYLKQASSHAIHFACGRYRCVIGAFQRLRGYGRRKIPLYKKLEIELGTAT